MECSVAFLSWTVNNVMGAVLLCNLPPVNSVTLGPALHITSSSDVRHPKELPALHHHQMWDAQSSCLPICNLPPVTLLKDIDGISVTIESLQCHSSWSCIHTCICVAVFMYDIVQLTTQWATRVGGECVHVRGLFMSEWLASVYKTYAWLLVACGYIILIVSGRGKTSCGACVIIDHPRHLSGWLCVLVFLRCRVGSVWARHQVGFRLV